MKLKDKQFIIWALDTGTLTKEDLSVKFAMEDIEMVCSLSMSDSEDIEELYNTLKKDRQRRTCSLCFGKLEKVRNKLTRKPICARCQGERHRQNMRDRSSAKRKQNKLSTG